MCPETLLDICAKVVAYYIPFQRIEERCQRIPEPVQARIIYWSFPRNERDICMYSSLSSDLLNCPSSNDSTLSEIPFYQGVRLFESESVENVLQVGFHLSGVVTVKSPLSSSNSSSSQSNYSQGGGSEKRYRVSITFDRCKITSVTCTCDSKDIFWCQHVVALTLYRIRNPNLVKLRVPISETLLQLDRQQLQKLIQYLISEHHTEVLPTAQRLTDEILQSHSNINRIAGAPDPTAGSCAEDEHSWHLDEEQVSEQVKSYLAQPQHAQLVRSNKQLNALFAKVKEMLRAKDSNAARMLRLITEQFLADPRLPTWRLQGVPVSEKCRPLWDQLGSLWVCVVLNPHATNRERQHWRNLLERWSKSSVCPLEDAVLKSTVRRGIKRRISVLEESSTDDDDDENLNNNNNERSRRNHANLSNSNHNSHSRQYGNASSSQLPRTIFHRALEASLLLWDDTHLRFILDNKSNMPFVPPPSCSNSVLFTSKGYPLWNEPIPTACARVEALRCHGYRQSALRLAVAVVRTMRRQQFEWQCKWQREQDFVTTACSNSDVCPNPIHCNTEGWLGNPLDPIGSLFDTLAEASLTFDQKPLDHYYPPFLGESSSQSSSVNSSHVQEEPAVLNVLNPIFNNDKPRYQHVVVPGSQHNETYLSLALEAALIALGQQRLMPPGSHAQEKAFRQENQLLMKLQDFDLDTNLVAVLRKQAFLLLEGGPFSGLGRGIHPESVPMHNFARYLFTALLQYDTELAYNVGLRAMRLPILENNDESSEAGGVSHSNVNVRSPRWHMLNQIEFQQRTLAATMLCAAKNDLGRLEMVLKSAQKNIHSYVHLFKLAESALNTAIPSDGRPRHIFLLKAAYELGLQVLRMTLHSLASQSNTVNSYKRRDVVKWMVLCATEVGLDALLTIMHKWSELFTPMEATMHVATPIMNPATVMKLGLDYRQQEDLSATARLLALQCAHKDPPNCALASLHLCENRPCDFETAYQTVLRAGSTGVMNSSQLFVVAKHMETRGSPPRAYKLALLAIKSVQISYNIDNHPSIGDIQWAFNLAMSLGKNELAGLIPILVKNVQCASVLSDILRRCSLGPPGFTAYMDGKRRCLKPLPMDRTPLRQLLEAAISAYVNSTHSRLTHISPRHYGDFIDFLSKARETFMLAPDGMMQFHSLIDNIKMAYKGKKKLMFLVKERFG